MYYWLRELRLSAKQCRRSLCKGESPKVTLVWPSAAESECGKAISGAPRPAFGVAQCRGERVWKAVFSRVGGG